MNMTRLRFFVIAVAFCFAALFLNIPFSVGQGIPVTPEAESDTEPDAINPLRISVNTTEVRLDVVVVDNKGRPITDLTADDFEVYQDKLPQDVTSSIYISDQSKALVSPTASRKDAPNLLPYSVPATILKEEEVRRTILFVVDNLSMSGQNLYDAKKMTIGHFLDRQMQPGDLVAVMHTGYGNSALNMFSSDKKRISQRADSIPNQGFAGGCYGDFAPMIYDNQLSTLSYSIRALKDMPGRKIIFFVTACPYIQNPFDNFTTLLESGGSNLTRVSEIAKNPYEKYAVPFERLTDEALRAGVVVHSLDVRGVGGTDPRDFSGAKNPLPDKTGGIFVTGSNYMLKGIGDDANNMIAGYYLVSYVPPPSTFELNKKDVYHHVNINVKRKGAVVYTRDGFYGRTGSETDSKKPPANTLANAIFSPFQYADLNVNMVAGYIKGPRPGYVVNGPGRGYVVNYPDYVVRTWIHLDSKDLKIVETEDGGARIDLETTCLTSDINGYVHDLKEIKYSFDIKHENRAENIAWIQKHGLRFSLLLPVKKPGSYTIHIAIRDAESGKVGSAYQFVEIPDLKKKRMSMSSIFMVTSADDIVWMSKNVMMELTKGMFFPMLYQDEGIRSPALRTYSPEDRLQTFAVLYNTDPRALSRSEIEIQSILYKDGVELLSGEPIPVAAPGNERMATEEGISILRRFTMGTDIQPGDYLLQLLVTDKKNSEKRDGKGLSPKEPGLVKKIFRAYINEPIDYSSENKGVASQVLSFTITEK